ncbi:MAG: PDZ domain-containing protein [Nocardioidaceae bacterium]|nr:PDZ domain-containing protein [Nocardioidaceae bacterium]NUS51789.1 PDZ domain-containing protein [Nocardioidaceae bacterium]
MSRRTTASLLVFFLLAALVVVLVFVPVPYVTMSPGPTVNVLGDGKQGTPIIQVQGRRTYPTTGQLRLTTVSVTNPTREIGLVEALSAWFDGTRAVYPRDAIYPPDQSPDDVQQQSSGEMVSSQDTAVAAALTELGYKLPLQVEVLSVSQDAPADGKLDPRDRVLEVNGTTIRSADQVSKVLQRSGVGEPATFVVERRSDRKTVKVTPEAAPDDPNRAIVGVQVGTGYDFPFDVNVNLDDTIGGPSAGLVFALGVYDTLTPGSLVDGNKIAGTGTIDEEGRVGPIGGIQQKIVAAADAGASVFLVPPADCQAALDADVTPDEIKLVKAPTMHSAVTSLEAYAKDEGADLPACS